MLENREGQTVPEVKFRVRRDHTWLELSTDDVFSGKTVVIFSLPGAFTPTCSTYQVPGFEDMYDETKHLNKEKFTTYQYFKRDNLSMAKTRNNLEKVKKHYNNNSNINLLQGNSYFDETETNFKEELNSNEIDLLFIDGDHTLDGVKNDYERYSKYVKKEGYIIFDDYHHPIIKEYCDKLLKENSSIKLITKFKSFKTDAIDLLVQIV